MEREITIVVQVPIEIDVTYVNKTWFSMKNGGSQKEKQYVIGIFQREGQAIIQVLENNNPETIEKVVLKNVVEGCTLYAEENILPEVLTGKYEIQQLKTGTHVNGDIHVNNVKNMWKDLKRVLKRTHIQVSPKHLHLYCAEVVWRVNTRHLSASEKFNLALSNCVIPDGQKRGTYQDLIK